MDLDLNKFAPPDPTAPAVLDLAKCRKLIDNVRVMERLPSGPMFGEMAAQMKILIDERGAFSGKLSTAQGDAIRFQREVEQANVEIGTLRAELVKAREKIVELTPLASAVVEAPAKAKRGRKAKVVPIGDQKQAAQ